MSSIISEVATWTHESIGYLFEIFSVALNMIIGSAHHLVHDNLSSS
jgi:hypothetical protein